MSKSENIFGHPSWLRQREFRQRLSMGHSVAFYKGLYSSISRCDSRDSPGFAAHGGIYSMDFSPDGSLLVTTWDRNGIQMFDPLSRNLIETVSNVHRGRIMKVKFLDSRTFVTGSADMTVALWDVRNLREQVLSLRGHSDTVCNIEISTKIGVLVTCGGNGMIHAWSLNNVTEESTVCRKVFGSYDFSRMRLSPDASKMVISSSRGYLLIVHDLDLNTLAEDVAGYYPGACPLYHLQDRVPCCHVDVYSRRRRRNRVEPVTDFPLADDCHVISALEIHPEGVSALSRSTNEEKELQWLCVHDIRDREPAGGKDEDEDEVAGAAQGAEEAAGWQGATPPEPEGRDEDAEGALGSREHDESAAMSILGSIAAMALDPGESSRAEFERVGEGEGEWRDLQDEAAAVAVLLSPPESEEEFGCPVDTSSPKSDREVRPPLPRLTHYAGSSSNGMLCSEELCFSPDGRLMCSPFESGIKLHTFSPECFDQFFSWSGGEAVPLHELATHTYHDTTVISTRFSPRHCLIVSGCLRGKINWYQPVL